MNRQSQSLDGGAALAKKLLRFGTDSPRCAKCGNDDIRTLCRIPRRGKVSPKILCRNCKGRLGKISPQTASRQARRFADAGYFKPACVICNEPTLQILELDHLANVANGDLTEPLCANHHAIKSHLAETGPMAALRLRDPQRRALVLEAAFDFGLAAMLALFAAWEGAHAQAARAVFFDLASGGLFAWATWNLAADEHFVAVLGTEYDRAIPALVPR